MRALRVDRRLDPLLVQEQDQEQDWHPQVFSTPRLRMRSQFGKRAAGR